MKPAILVADDDATQRRFVTASLTASGHAVIEAPGGQAALDRLLAPGGPVPDLLLLDLNMPDLDGITVLRRLRAAGHGLPVLVLTSDGSVNRAVAAMQAGATDFLVKPIGPERLSVSIRNALALSTLSTEVRRLARSETNELSFDELIAQAPATRSAIALARRAARSDIPVLILGESGTGKEVFARAIHGSSERSGGPFVAVNCGALPAQLVESILFGHEKGAFTGAVTRRPGKFQEASGGTLFLDEVGELPAEAQVKLLRAIQTGEVDPVGASEAVRVDIRLVSATNRDLSAMIGEGAFREDLFYRIGVFPLTLPPLRERREDLTALARMFLARFAAAEEIPLEGFSQAAIEAIRDAPWPGNVRQLENIVHRAVVLTEGPRIQPEDLRGIAAGAPTARAAAPAPEPRPDAPPAATPAPEPATADPAAAFFGPDGHVRRLHEIESEAIRRALSRYRGRMSETARRLGIGRSTLYRKIDEMGLAAEDAEARGPARCGER
ncbi:sigma-54 dependent transcriptional regulator [Paralimibaculum aggregatum]|uniref:DNA-binding transcriptional regulator NtrC n=1 Tax=Paralimibaculum aggregatum TaxID=3036245 RepID=A0ABQ6LR06_9RHOB|nr:sigma-54 dependent transcriptional regulator [Limibaculum sp. NKW23]GMG83753.1 sigma-54 dependent transcriptional regulator [Limibaculum sp. NKW23]